MFTLAHLSDPHLGSMPVPGFRALAGKRALGYLSWRSHRKAIHDGPVLPTLAADLRSAAPDHIAITGDITNIALPEEFTRAREWLNGLGEPSVVTVVPGNHDAYVGVPWESALGKWTPFMSGVAANLPAEDAPVETPVSSTEDFPFVRLRGPIAIVGVSSACPTPVFSAAGRCGAAQLAALADRLTELGQRKLFRVVLIHHPPLGGRAKRRKQLLDSADFCAVIARAGAELILHGHTHRSALAKIPRPKGSAPVIGVPSASARPDIGKGRSRYHLYRIEQIGAAWRLGVEVRGVTDDLDRFITEGQFTLTIPG
ncbi:metallophosphoesterase family protein [Rhodospirillaceae bacterium SYSU D60014]|uniref:metallophosphoesterase family protein n=1 Tax=Virgifigura deserti TaxID=2268457 RepID=UPI000E66563D